MSTVTTPATTTPTDVPGYADHERRRLRPRVPATPPPLTVRPSSASTGLHALFGVPVFFAAFVIALELVGDGGRVRPAGLLAFLATIGAALALLAWLVRRWGRALVAEIEQGYSTTRVTMGSWWIGEPRNGRRLQGIQWDWSGLWYLDRSGRVKAAPLPTPTPPGWYPSPHAPERLELWTGHMWTTHLGDRTDGLLP